MTLRVQKESTMRSLRRRATGGASAALAGLALAACSGPAAPLDVGTQTAPISLVLGTFNEMHKPPIGPKVPVARDFFLPTYPTPGVPNVEPTLPPFVDPCPRLDPTVPALGVGRTVPAPPVKATYPYAATVLDSYAGTSYRFMGTSQWSVSAAPPDETGAYEVTYSIRLGKDVTTRVLRTLPRDVATSPEGLPGSPIQGDATNPNDIVKEINTRMVAAGVAATLPTGLPNLAGYGRAGIYLVSQVQNGVTFRPSAPIALLQLRQLTGLTDPAARADASITSVGYDPVSKAYMAFRSTVVDEGLRLNACGKPVEAVKVALGAPTPPATPRDLTGVAALFADTGAAVYVAESAKSTPQKPAYDVIPFRQELMFGLQYGGLLVQESAAALPSYASVVQPDEAPGTPSGVPSAEPGGDPQDVVSAAAGWAATPILEWAHRFPITKIVDFRIMVQPRVPKKAS